MTVPACAYPLLHFIPCDFDHIFKNKKSQTHSNPAFPGQRYFRTANAPMQILRCPILGFSPALALAVDIRAGAPVEPLVVIVVEGNKGFSGQKRKTLPSFPGLCHPMPAT